MHNFAKIGLAAALLVGGANIAIAQDTDTGLDTGVDVGVDAEVDAGTDTGMDAGADAGADASVDTSTTGSIGAQDKNYGSVISSLQSGASADLTAFNESSSVNCVAISSLQGEAGGNAQALDNAIEKNQSSLIDLRSSIEANAELMTELETTCAASLDDFNVEDVIAVETGADGAFIFYVDDRA